VPGISATTSQVAVEKLCPATPAFTIGGPPTPCIISPSLVSAANVAGAQPSNQSSFTPSISGDGRYVAFVSQATNLPGMMTAGADWQVFVRDTCGGSNAPSSGCTPSTSLTSLSGGVGASPADGVNWLPSISADGSTVAFASSATNIVSGGGDGLVPQIFVHGPMNCIPMGRLGLHCPITTIAISGPTTVSGANGIGGVSPSLSADGGHVAYQELNFVAGNAEIADIKVVNTCVRHYLLNLCAYTSNVASTPNPKGWIAGSIAVPTGGVAAPSISADGHVVTFLATAPGVASNIEFALTGF